MTRTTSPADAPRPSEATIENPAAPCPAPPRHLLSSAALSRDDWASLLRAAERLAGPAGRLPLLAGRRLGALFFNPSLRTRLSFEVACHDLGATAVVLQPGADTWGFEHRPDVVMDGAAAEHVREAVGVLSRMLDGIGVRCFAGLDDPRQDEREELLTAIATAATVPVLNLESAGDHPLQGLADALTLRRRLSGRRATVVLSWTPHVKPLPMAVPNAVVTALCREGHDVRVVHPPGFELSEGVLEAAGSLAREAGGALATTDDRAQALSGAEVVYAKSWGASGYGGRPDRAAEGFARHADWRITAADLRSALFMHCLPVRRGVVVDGAVLDSPASLVLEQAAARLDVQKAALCRALGVDLEELG
jgi:N-acetylornithine carbamoyltransferase